MTLNYVKPERISLKNHPDFNEKWLQDRIADDPSIIGLGDLILKDRERIHSKAGRLDLLLQDAEENRRYEVEIQLGATDESHIIRTIEYWDIERKRYPQYEHTAVIIAEDITSRFLNVISLFNGAIPLIALQLNAIKVDNCVSLVFTKVLDELRFGLIGEDEEVQPIADRPYWEQRGTKATLKITDELFSWLKDLDPELELKYNKFYIGLAKNNIANTFILFRPKKQWLRLEIRLEKTDELDTRLDEAGLDVMDYDTRWKKYRIKVTKHEIKKNEALIKELMSKAYEASYG